MKNKILFVCIFILCTKLFGNEIKIYAPVAQNFLIDKNNYVRYSTLNMFDNSSDTVFAVNTYGNQQSKTADNNIFW